MLHPTVHIARGGHPERGREGGTGVTRAVAVMGTLGSEQKPIESAVLAHRGKAPKASSKHLVDVALVTDIEKDVVSRRVEDSMEGDRELDDSEVGTEVTSRLGKCSNQLVANFLRKARKLGLGNFLQVGGGIDPVEQAH
jgi:hypothetical protein